MDYFEKIDKNPYEDLFWNVPEEQKRGGAIVIGGNEQSFRTPVSVSEFLMNNFPLKTVQAVLPDSLKNKLPPLDNFVFLRSTDTGSFADGDELTKAIDNTDFSVLVGDMSKNSITKEALLSAVCLSEKPIIATRDAVDLIAEGKLEKILMREDLIIFGSILQWQKIFKGVYYPKILQPSQSLVQVAEAFHKFTLSYPTQVIAIHEGQIVIAKNGNVKVVAIGNTGYTMLTIYNGELAAKIAAMNYYNPNKFIEASIAALFR